MAIKYRYLLIFILIEVLTLYVSRYAYGTYYNLIFTLYLVIFPLIFYLILKQKFSVLAYITLFYAIFKFSPFVFNVDNSVFSFVFKWKRVISIIYLLYLITRIITAIRSIKKENNSSDDDLTNILFFLLKYFRIKKVARLLNFEVGAFYYCFFKWRKNKTTHLEFTSYKKNGSTYQLYIVILFITLIEAYALQIFLHKKHPIISEIFLYIHIYFFITIIGHLKATYYRRNVMLHNKFIVRYGLFESLEIPFENIEKINKDYGSYDKTDKNTVKFGLLGQLEFHNILIRLKEAETVYLPFGKYKTPKRILLYVDESEELINFLDTHLLP